MISNVTSVYIPEDKEYWIEFVEDSRTKKAIRLDQDELDFLQIHIDKLQTVDSDMAPVLGTGGHD